MKCRIRYVGVKPKVPNPVRPVAPVSGFYAVPRPPLLAARWKACVGPLSPEHRVLSAALMERLRYAGGRGKAGVVHLQPTLGPQAMRGHRVKGPLHAARRQA